MKEVEPDFYMLMHSGPVVEFRSEITTRLSWFKPGMRARLIKMRSVGGDVHQLYFNTSEFTESNKQYENPDREILIIDDRYIMLKPSQYNNFTVQFSLVCDDEHSLRDEAEKYFKIIS